MRCCVPSLGSGWTHPWFELPASFAEAYPVPKSAGVIRKARHHAGRQCGLAIDWKELFPSGLRSFCKRLASPILPGAAPAGGPPPKTTGPQDCAAQSRRSTRRAGGSPVHRRSGSPRVRFVRGAARQEFLRELSDLVIDFADHVVHRADGGLLDLPCALRRLLEDVESIEHFKRQVRNRLVDLLHAGRSV